MSRVLAPTRDTLLKASRALAAGHLVVFPTETVYGLGADGLNPTAVARIFQVKGRPADHPVILHVADLAQARALAESWPAQADLLARQFWPGPLTLILKRAAHVPNAVTGGQDTVGVRIPAHPVAQALLAYFSEVGSGVVAAPSANRFGGLSPTRAQDVDGDIGDRLQATDMILDGGECTIGVESTIVDLSGDRPRILRPGGVDRAEIESALSGQEMASARDPLEVTHSRPAPRVSGALESHYAPRTPMRLLPWGELLYQLHVKRVEQPSARIACLTLHLPDDPPDPSDHSRLWMVMPAQAHGYAHDLYARLHDLDALGFDLLLVERPPETPEWEAVQDRLMRAAAR